eukprot:5829813-Alexandrium_andersonii.AAC.1
MIRAGILASARVPGPTPSSDHQRSEARHGSLVQRSPRSGRAAVIFVPIFDLSVSVLATASAVLGRRQVGDQGMQMHACVER